MPTSILQNKSPFKCLFGHLPDYKKKYVFLVVNVIHG
jgi:hypothetical protein